MARPLRIEYPGAWYHAMNRGRRGEDTFSDQKDFKTIISNADFALYEAKKKGRDLTVLYQEKMRFCHDCSIQTELNLNAISLIIYDSFLNLLGPKKE